MLIDLIGLARARQLLISKISYYVTKKESISEFSLSAISGFSRLAISLHGRQDIVDGLFASLPESFSFAGTPSPVPCEDARLLPHRNALICHQNRMMDISEFKRCIRVLEAYESYKNRMHALGITIESNDDEAYAKSVREVFRAITPMHTRGAKKIRIGGVGGERDGGYVMLDPGRDGIAYSLGVSSNSPWGMEMTRRGFTVYQYDGSIFKRDGPSSPGKPFTKILAEHQHETENALILHMDIEGAEWDVLEELTEDALLKFNQIIVALHGLGTNLYKCALLDKIRHTHTPIHVHYNNCAKNVVLSMKNCFIYNASLIEVSYARTNDYIFEPCNDYFPTPLDRQSVELYPEIPIGYFRFLDVS
jgi:hypothetical protein